MEPITYDVENNNKENWKFFIPPRDFVGYGFDEPSDCWPNGAKIAVSFVLNYEEGAEHSTWNGDAESEAFLFETSYHHPLHVGTRDPTVESQFEYGIRAGLPRLLKLFDEFGWKFTTWATARSFEVTDFYPKLLVEKGHEIACHGNRWRNIGEMHGPDEEAWHIRKSFERLQKATGLKNVPTAWFIGSCTPYAKHMRAKIHKETGVPLVYCSDTYAGDLPYWIENPLTVDGEKDDGLLMVPYSLTNNDHRFMVIRGTGVSSPNDWLELLKTEFDELYAEGLAGKPKLMTVAMHNRMLGKPSRAIVLRRFMEYVKSKPDVWVTTREKIAEHWKEKYPYEKVGITRKMHYNDY